MFGQDKRFETLTNLALDRIENIEETDQQYIDSEIDFNEYFEDIIGVSVNEKVVEQVILKVSNNSINYIKTKPLHGSQKVKEEKENYTIVELELIPNYELEALILSFGENIEILEPIELRERIKNRINSMLNNYVK